MPLFLSILGGLISFGSSISAANERRREAEQAAYDTELEKKQLEIQAIEEENERVKAYDELVRTALTMSAYTGNEINIDTALQRGYKAFETDIIRVQRQSLLQTRRMQTRADEFKRSGRAAQRTGYTSAFANLITSGLRQQDAKYPELFNRD
tara:strand:- start:3821 stop:4276 length:456 start_codon:yes stop_codon:yes gene_type:complete